MKDFSELINRSYEAIKSRGLINSQTFILDFIIKCREELSELTDESLKDIKSYSKDRICEEATDLATVCFMLIKWIGRDPIEEFEKVLKKNQERAKNGSKT